MRPPLVIVVDDDPGMGRAMARMIEAGGMTPRVYDSAEAMLDAERDSAACLVIDVQLPGMDGIELYHALAARGERLPVVFVSASENAQSRASELDGSLVTFLAKPFSGLALLDQVKAMLAAGA